MADGTDMAFTVKYWLIRYRDVPGCEILASTVVRTFPTPPDYLPFVVTLPTAGRRPAGGQQPAGIRGGRNCPEGVIEFDPYRPV